MKAVLTFHSVDDSGSVLSFPVKTFARLVEQLAKSGTPVVTFDELLRRDDGLAFTFDDGMRSVCRNALPVLREHGFPAHLFLTTGRVGRDIGWPEQGSTMPRFEMLAWPDIEACVRGGFRVESHTVSHPDLRRLAPAAMLDECSGADEEIERRIGRRPTLFAYPFGYFDDVVRHTVSPRYEGCFTTRLGYLRRNVDRSRVGRLDSYYLQAPVWHERLFAARTRGYVALRAAIRAVRGVT
jgi:peptidoglycan/xylan/chitin deacetylase (PgdA/CDA1 family)